MGDAAFPGMGTSRFVCRHAVAWSVGVFAASASARDCLRTGDRCLSSLPVLVAFEFQVVVDVGVVVKHTACLYAFLCYSERWGRIRQPAGSQHPVQRLLVRFA